MRKTVQSKERLVAVIQSKQTAKKKQPNGEFLFFVSFTHAVRKTTLMFGNHSIKTFLNSENKSQQYISERLRETEALTVLEKHNKLIWQLECDFYQNQMDQK
jgi:hypothetical protein